MNKPITMQIKELKTQIIKDINESELPAFIIETMFRDLYNEIRLLAIEQEKREEQEYEHFLIEKDKQKDEKESA